MSDGQSLFDMFAREMNRVLENSEVTYKDQEMLLKKLCKAEYDFRQELLRTKRNRTMYDQFMSFILHEKKNILAARIYFRERQETFSRKISKAFYDEKPQMLHRFRINYWFATWVVNRLPSPNKKLDALLAEMKVLRNQLCETNMPLAIHQAKVFWSKVPADKLEYVDLIQACGEGLLNAIDKFVPPYSTVFLSTAIGRMKSNMIDDFSSTIIKFSPKEKRIIYRAKNAKKKQKLEKQSDIVKYVNESFVGVTGETLDRLTTASSTPISLNETTDESHEIINTFASDDDVEAGAINRDMVSKAESAFSTLSVLEQKVLLLTHGMMFSRGQK